MQRDSAASGSLRVSRIKHLEGSTVGDWGVTIHACHCGKICIAWLEGETYGVHGAAQLQRILCPLLLCAPVCMATTASQHYHTLGHSILLCTYLTYLSMPSSALYLGL